jgi:signal transduction histidine kinase
VSVSSYTGHGFYWIWPNTSIINSYLAPLSIGFGFLTSVLFMSSFLEIRRRGVLGERVYRVSVGISLLVILSAILLSYSNAIRVMSIAQISLTIVIMSFSIYLWRKGVVEAKYFTIAWTFFVLGNLINSMRVVGIMPSNNFTFYANLYGNIIEMLLLSMGLAYRFETMRKAQIGLSRELRASQLESIINLEKFRDLFQKSPVGLFRYDRVNNRFINNSKAIELVGHETEIALFLKKYLTFSDYKQLLKTKVIKHRVLKLDDGKYYSLSLLAIRNDDNRIVEVEGTLTDISSQKQAEVNRIKNEKEKLNTLTQLVVGISHQFNTPLGVLVTTEDLIKNNLTSILSDIESGQLKKNELVQNLNMIQEGMSLTSENTKVMSTILKDLRCSISTRGDLNISEISLNSFFYDLFGFYKAQLKEIEKECGYELSVELNDVSTISCDYDVISDVFLRLFENTYSHAFVNNESEQSEGNIGRVEILLSENEEEIVVDYYDNGRGLDAAEQENIFIPFFTGNSRKKENSGLGMYILHNQVVKVLNGKVTLLSPKSGFGIKIQIPKVNADAIEF